MPTRGVARYKDDRLYMDIGLVTPTAEHDGRADGIMPARHAGMKQRARDRGSQGNQECSEESGAA
jgi:hypothetical protein